MTVGLVHQLNTIDALYRMWRRGEEPWAVILEQIVGMGASDVTPAGFVFEGIEWRSPNEGKLLSR